MHPSTLLLTALALVNQHVAGSRCAVIQQPCQLNLSRGELCDLESYCNTNQGTCAENSCRGVHGDGLCSSCRRGQYGANCQATCEQAPGLVPPCKLDEVYDFAQKRCVLGASEDQVTAYHLSIVDCAAAAAWLPPDADPFLFAEDPTQLSILEDPWWFVLQPPERAGQAPTTDSTSPNNECLELDAGSGSLKVANIDMSPRQRWTLENGTLRVDGACVGIDGDFRAVVVSDCDAFQWYTSYSASPSDVPFNVRLNRGTHAHGCLAWHAEDGTLRVDANCRSENLVVGSSRLIDGVRLMHRELKMATDAADSDRNDSQLRATVIARVKEEATRQAQRQTNNIFRDYHRCMAGGDVSACADALPCDDPTCAKSCQACNSLGSSACHEPAEESPSCTCFTGFEGPTCNNATQAVDCQYAFDTKRVDNVAYTTTYLACALGRNDTAQVVESVFATVLDAALEQKDAANVSQIAAYMDTQLHRMQDTFQHKTHIWPWFPLLELMQVDGFIEIAKPEQLNVEYFLGVIPTPKQDNFEYYINAMSGIPRKCEVICPVGQIASTEGEALCENGAKSGQLLEHYMSYVLCADIVVHMESSSLFGLATPDTLLRAAMNGLSPVLGGNTTSAFIDLAKVAEKYHTDGDRLAAMKQRAAQARGELLPRFYGNNGTGVVKVPSHNNPLVNLKGAIDAADSVRQKKEQEQLWSQLFDGLDAFDAQIDLLATDFARHINDTLKNQTELVKEMVTQELKLQIGKAKSLEAQLRALDENKAKTLDYIEALFNTQTVTTATRDAKELIKAHVKLIQVGLRDDSLRNPLKDVLSAMETLFTENIEYHWRTSAITRKKAPEDNTADRERAFNEYVVAQDQRLAQLKTSMQVVQQDSTGFYANVQGLQEVATALETTWRDFARDQMLVGKQINQLQTPDWTSSVPVSYNPGASLVHVTHIQAQLMEVLHSHGFCTSPSSITERTPSDGQPSARRLSGSQSPRRGNEDASLGRWMEERSLQGTSSCESDSRGTNAFGSSLAHKDATNPLGLDGWFGDITTAPTDPSESKQYAEYIVALDDVHSSCASFTNTMNTLFGNVNRIQSNLAKYVDDHRRMAMLKAQLDLHNDPAPVEASINSLWHLEATKDLVDTSSTEAKQKLRHATASIVRVMVEQQSYEMVHELFELALETCNAFLYVNPGVTNKNFLDACFGLNQIPGVMNLDQTIKHARNVSAHLEGVFESDWTSGSDLLFSDRDVVTLDVTHLIRNFHLIRDRGFTHPLEFTLRGPVYTASDSGPFFPDMDNVEMEWYGVIFLDKTGKQVLAANGALDTPTRVRTTLSGTTIKTEDGVEYMYELADYTMELSVYRHGGKPCTEPLYQGQICKMSPNSLSDHVVYPSPYRTWSVDVVNGKEELRDAESVLVLAQVRGQVNSEMRTYVKPEVVSLKSLLLEEEPEPADVRVNLISALVGFLCGMVVVVALAVVAFRRTRKGGDQGKEYATQLNPAFEL